MLAEGSDDAPGVTGEGGPQQHTQAALPASGKAALARQLAQATLSEAELQQRLRCALGYRDSLLMWHVDISGTSPETPEVMRDFRPPCAVCVKQMPPPFLLRSVILLLCCRIASSAEDTLRARLAQREQRLAKLSGALGSMQSRAAEDRRRSSRAADEQCRHMREAATTAEPLLKRLSEDGAINSAPVGPASRAGDSHAQAASSQAVAVHGTKVEHGDSSSVHKLESERDPESCQTDTAGASQHCVGAVTEPADPAAAASQECASAIQPDLQKPSRGSLQPAAVAAPGVLTSVPHDSRGACDLGISTQQLRLAEDAEDLRLELAQRMAQAAGLQSRVDHLMACQSEHESTKASQAAQLAAQSEVGLPEGIRTCSLFMLRQALCNSLCYVFFL